jgi:3-dehydroquinate synthetase
MGHRLGLRSQAKNLANSLVQPHVVHICAAACRAQPSESIDGGCSELIEQSDELLNVRCKRLD